MLAASLSAAAAMLECSPIDLKKAKKAGAPGFRSNGSVNISELRPWLAENLEASSDTTEKEALECRRLIAQCERLEFGNEVERAKFMHVDAVGQQARECASATRTEMMRIKADAPTWSGLAPEEIDRRVSSLLDSICRNLHERWA